MINWLNIFKHVLPRAKAWRITVEKTLRRFFDGLSSIGSDSKEFFDNIFDDIDPQKTRQLDLWEGQFALRDTVLTEQERRDRLDATWEAFGGQDPRYIEDTLRNAGFDVYVHEWWEPIIGRPNGGSIDGDVIPVARNPFDYLYDGVSGLKSLMFDGGSDSQTGDSVSQDGGSSQPQGYPLVNKITTSTQTLSQMDGSSEMSDGDGDAIDGSSFIEYSTKQYVMPADINTYPFYLYIGGETFPGQAIVKTSRRDEFEDLCLKICPTEQWLGMLITYS